MKSNQELANTLHALASSGEFETIKKTYFATDCKSLEPAHATLFKSEQGLDAIVNKGTIFNSMVEVLHGLTVGEPAVYGSSIFMPITFDVTLKGVPRMEFREMVRYDVSEGKVVCEEFYY